MVDSPRGADARRGGMEPIPVPDEIGSTNPGPVLDEMLSSIDVESVSGFDTVEVMKAWSRQIARDKAEFLKAVLETGIREPSSAAFVSYIADEPGEFAPEEMRAALAWSRRRARDTFDLAKDVHQRLPTIGKAMMAGELDEYRAAALAQWTRGLGQPHAAHICDQLIANAAGMTVRTLIDHIKRLAIMLDPEWAQRRYREAVRRRRVVGTHTADGTAKVSGIDLPVDRAKAGCDRIGTLGPQMQVTRRQARDRPHSRRPLLGHDRWRVHRSQRRRDRRLRPRSSFGRRRWR